MRSLIAIRVAVVIMLVGLAASLPAQEAQENDDGFVERLGERFDRGVEQLGRELRRSWAEIRQSVDELSVQGRVYGRLRWDKALADETIDIDVQSDNVVVLSGMVADEPTRRKAVKLAEDTVGVRDVISRLEVTPQAGTR
jgi:osmotically-inducible protein OsmY